MSESKVRTLALGEEERKIKKSVREAERYRKGDKVMIGKRQVRKGRLRKFE